MRSIAAAISFVSIPLGPREPHALPLEARYRASKSRAVYQLEPSTGVAPLASPPVRCRHSDTRYTDGSIQIGRRSAAMGKGDQGRGTGQALFVSHGENAIPAGRRLIEEIILAALPIGAGRAVAGPFVENGLERFLRVFPAALAVEFMGPLEEIETVTHFARGAVNRVFSGAADEFVNGNRLEFAFHADEIEFAEDVAIVLGGGIRGFVDQDVRAVIFIQPFQARGEIHGVAESGVAVTERRAHVADAGHAGVQADADVEMRLAFGFPFLLHVADALHHFQSCMAGSGRVAGFFEGRAPESHDGVADVLVESAVVLEDEAGHVREVLVEKKGQVLGVEFFGYGGKAADVAE